MIIEWLRQGEDERFAYNSATLSVFADCHRCLSNSISSKNLVNPMNGIELGVEHLTHQMLNPFRCVSS